MFKKNQWVVINETGKVGKITRVFNSDSYEIEIDGVVAKPKYIGWQFNYSDLSPAPKTWQTLEVGDIIVDGDGDKAKVLEVGENTFFMSVWNNFDIAHTYLYTFTEAESRRFKIEGVTAEQEAIALLKKNGYQIIKNK